MAASVIGERSAERSERDVWMASVLEVRAVDWMTTSEEHRGTYRVRRVECAWDQHRLMLRDFVRRRR